MFVVLIGSCLVSIVCWPLLFFFKLKTFNFRIVSPWCPWQCHAIPATSSSLVSVSPGASLSHALTLSCNEILALWSVNMAMPTISGAFDLHALCILRTSRPLLAWCTLWTANLLEVSGHKKKMREEGVHTALLIQLTFRGIIHEICGCVVFCLLLAMFMCAHAQTRRK